MPQPIQDEKLLTILSALKEIRDALDKDQEELRQFCHQKEEELDFDNRQIALHKKQREAFVMANELYGWGGWADLNAQTNTYIPKEEFAPNMYIMNNPAVREKVTTDDIVLEETHAEEVDALVDDALTRNKITKDEVNA